MSNQLNTIEIDPLFDTTVNTVCEPSELDELSLAMIGGGEFISPL